MVRLSAFVGPVRRLSWLAAFLALASCQTAPRPPSPPAPHATAATPSAFAQWLDGVRAEGRHRGVSDATLSAAFSNLAPLAHVLELDQRQPEYSQTFWHYLDGAVSPQRVADGHALLLKYDDLLRHLEAQYGVPAPVLVAFWGLETNYGHDSGTYPVIGALATLAFEGRRTGFFRGELFNALMILDRGDVGLGQMTGSWAGAMGQTQFMPSTYLKYAVDGDGDGRVDIWSDIPDALASAANYLNALGWMNHRGWGREVLLPGHFDVGLASIDSEAMETVKPLAAWAALGVREADGRPLPRADMSAALVLPQGATGPAFLVYDNYRVILRWNHSMFYAVAIGHLSDRLVGKPPLKAEHGIEPPLRREEILAMQDALHRLGFLNATPDGVVGGATRQAVRVFQRVHGFAPDGYASRAIAAAIVATATIPAGA